MKKWVWKKLTEEEMIQKGKDLHRMMIEEKVKVAAMTPEEREAYHKKIDEDECCCAGPLDQELVEIDVDEG
ncbi:MAG: hypothetical protein P4L42_03415 [Desulfocapsaceae bacterium]|nr:hypothetical protein [Desulfocapsaceae bacterium]